MAAQVDVGAVDIAAVDNRATVSRTTAGVSKYGLSDPARDEVIHRYTRDVHSPAIARRAGIHLYRHFSFAPIESALLPGLHALVDVSTDRPRTEQLTGAGHLDYLDGEALAAFYDSPSEAIRRQLLADIEVIGGPPGRTTTYRTSPGGAWTFVDRTAEPAPQGPTSDRVALWLRRRDGTRDFGPALFDACRAWAADHRIRRLRLHVFDEPDMAVESTHGYPVFPAPPEEHYHAWMDICTDGAGGGGAGAIPAPEGTAARLAALADAVHAQPVTVVYTYVWDGRPTVVGLRGYPAWELITTLGATNQLHPELLDWMYGRGRITASHTTEGQR